MFETIISVVNECDGKICHNNGTCEDLDGISTWRCNCVAGFIGMYCERGEFITQNSFHCKTLSTYTIALYDNVRGRIKTY